MQAKQRREEIIKLLQEAKQPLSGSAIAKALGVSRQIIVGDIALIRASNQNILSTNKGYIIEKHDEASMVIKSYHDHEHIIDELFTIVDLGGYVKDVSINHKIYGRITGPLDIDSRRKAKEFMKLINSGASEPLSSATSGYHYHTILAESEEILEEIKEALDEKGYLVK